MTKDIYVFIEQRDNHILDGSKQLLAKALELVSTIKSQKFEVVGVLLGHNCQGLVNEVFSAGADRLIVCDHEKLAHYNTQHYTNVLNEIIEKFHPDSFLVSATTIGRDLAPRVAARANTGLTADATSIEIDPTDENSTTLWVTRPAFGGNLFGTIVCPNTRPQMATIRPNVFKALSHDYVDSKREVIEYTYNCQEADAVVFKERIKKAAKAVDISKAEVILAAGRGLKDKFNDVVALATELGVAPAASRALVDANIAPKELQVGQTGTTVSPKIYIACGISGAVQHTAGMDKSETIIAINTDPHAAIFSIANAGFVADAAQVLPLLKQEIAKIKAEKNM